MTAVAEFGKLIADLRQKSYKSLRDFCLKTGYDAVLVSKWERGLAPAPDDRRKLEHLAKSLGLTEDSEEANRFIQIAEKAHQEYAPREVPDEEIRSKLPGAFRGLRVDEDPQDIISEAWKIAREAHDPESK